MIYKLTELPPEYAEVVNKIDVLRTQLQYATSDSRRRWTGFLRRTSFARAIQGSNSIEGININEEDAVAAVDNEEPLSADEQTWREIEGYRSAMSYVLQLHDDPYFSHNEGVLRSLHYMMISFDISKHPGRWRPGQIWVKNEASQKIVYEGPDAEFVPSLMAELVTSLNEKNALPVMVRAALAHLNLVMIHPFSDGNGRMGRALQTMVLAREGILDPTFSSIEEYLGRNTPEYYAVLGEVGQGAWHPENDPLPWVRFCLVAHYRQAETLLRRTKEVTRMWEAIESELKRRHLNERMTVALMDAAHKIRVRNSAYRKSVDVSDEVASRDLKMLVEQDLLVPQGERRGRCYVASDWLNKLYHSTREPRAQTLDPFDTTKSTASFPELFQALPLFGDDEL